MTPRRTIIDSLHRCLCPQYFNSLPSVRNGLAVALKIQHLSFARPKNFSSSAQVVPETTSSATHESTTQDAYSPQQDHPRGPIIRKLVTPCSVSPKSRTKHKHFSGTTVAFRSPDSKYMGLDKVIDLATRSVFPGVFLAAEELVREQGYVPDGRLYTALIEACASFPGCLLQGLAFRLLDEMKERNLVVGSVIYHSLLRLLANSPDYLKRLQVLGEMKQGWYTLTDEGWQNVIAGYILDGHLEMAMEIIEKRRNNGQVLHRSIYKDVITGLCTVGEVGEALRLVRDLEATEITWATSQELAYHILAAATEQLHLEATLTFWRKVIDGNMFNPDDGLCLATLNVAARYGEPPLASDVFRVLGNRGVKFEEHHYAALLESYVVSGDLTAAFSVLTVMRKAGVPPTEHTAHSIVRRLTQGDGIIPQDAFEILQSVQRRGHSVDLAALNALMAAHVARADLDAAFEVYNRLPDFDLRPETSTFNILISGARQEARKDFALNVVSEMKEMKVPPDASTYEGVFGACLAQDDYEDAFLWLEEMNSRGMRPKIAMYGALARRCYGKRDGRYRVALAVMVKKGVNMGKFLALLAEDDHKMADAGNIASV